MFSRDDTDILETCTWHEIFLCREHPRKPSMHREQKQGSQPAGTLGPRGSGGGGRWALRRLPTGCATQEQTGNWWAGSHEPRLWVSWDHSSKFRRKPRLQHHLVTWASYREDDQRFVTGGVGKSGDATGKSGVSGELQGAQPRSRTAPSSLACRSASCACRAPGQGFPAPPRLSSQPQTAAGLYFILCGKMAFWRLRAGTETILEFLQCPLGPNELLSTPLKGQPAPSQLQRAAVEGFIHKPWWPFTNI